VQRWVAEQPVTNLFTTTVTQAEILFGLALLPEGRRRSDLLVAAEQMFAEDFADRVLAFNTPAAIKFATIAATRRRHGRPTVELPGKGTIRLTGIGTCTVDRTVVVGTPLLVGRTVYDLPPCHNQPLGSLRGTTLADCAGYGSRSISQRPWLALHSSSKSVTVPFLSDFNKSL